MKRHISIFSLLFSSLFIFAQEKVSVQLEEAPLNLLFNRIEEQTPYRIFCNPVVADTLLVTVNITGGEPYKVMEQVLSPLGYQVTRYQQAFFVTDKEVTFITALPDNYFVRDERSDPGQTGSLMLFNRRDQKATSESKVYEVGDSREAKTGTLRLNGNVSNYKTGEPMIGITLFSQDRKTAVTTDTEGNYSIELPAGRSEILIRGIGFEDTKRQVMLYTDGKLDIELEEQIYALDEITISSERIQNVRSTTLGVERLKLNAIKNVPTAFGEVDILRIVMSLPGVKSVGEVSNGFNVRGGSTDQNLILYNEGTVYNPTHLFGLFSAFNPDVVSDMELYKSSIPSKYGGRISSVLDINSREGNKEKFTGSASIGLLTSRLSVEGPLNNGRTTYVLGGRTTYSDWLLRQLPEKSGYKNGRAGFYDLNASINHRFNPYNTLSVHGYFSRDHFRFDEFDQYAYRNATASAKWKHFFTTEFIGEFSVGYDHYDYRTQNTENEATAYNLGFDINQYFAKADFNKNINDKHVFNFGFNTLFYDLSPGKYTPRGEESLVVPDVMQKERAMETAIYVGDTWDVTQDLSFNAGIRYSMFNALGPREYNLYNPESLPSLATITETVSKDGGAFKTYHGPEFRLSVRYEITDGLSVKAGYNTMRQYIQKLSNTTVMSPTDTWKLSDANIRPQTGSQIAAGIYKNLFRNSVEFSVEGYYKKMNNYLDYRSGAELVMNHTIETDVLETVGKAYGVEVMLKKQAGMLNGWVSYTYSRTQLRQKDLRITDPVNNGNWYSADYDKPHEFKLVGNYKFTHRYSASLNCDYSTGRPITLPVSKYYYGNGQYVYYSERNKYRIPDFFRMDLAFNIEPSHHLTLLTHSMISFGVYNLTGRKNAYSIYYLSEDGKLNGYKMAIFGVPIPYVSYNIKF